jgi:hypothetical protein
LSGAAQVIAESGSLREHRFENGYHQHFSPVRENRESGSKDIIILTSPISELSGILALRFVFAIFIARLLLPE